MRIAILGGGPSGMFIYKRLIESGKTDFKIEIFERKSQLGAGMPYSSAGANAEHVTNVSDNEIPKIVTSIEEWLQTAPAGLLHDFHIDSKHFNEYKVLPRLLFGKYLEGQFELLEQQAEQKGIATTVHFNSAVTDIIDFPESNETAIEISGQSILKFDKVIVCTGHSWPQKFEGIVPGYFDSPYPPSKLARKFNHTIAIKGASLTAIDAIRTLARQNGAFENEADGKLKFTISEQSPDFKIIMHSRSGLLPAVRFHLDDPHLKNNSLLTEDEIKQHIKANNGFLSLDFVFEKDFKAPLREKDEAFYNRVKDLDIEAFVDEMMELREKLDPFQLFKAEYQQAEKSIKRHESVYWKEMLAILSFAMNYPAKHLSAEDMQRLHKVLLPLISIVIAFVPQSSCLELLALHEAGVLDIIAVGPDGEAEPQKEGGIVYHYTDESGESQSVFFETFIDCVGQPHLSYEELPFKSLIKNKTASPARLKFRSAANGSKEKSDGNKGVVEDSDGSYYLKVSGIAINDKFQLLDAFGAYNARIYMMAVPYIGGFNPDYSGLDFCEEASAKIEKALFEN
ncbi:FAD/NAD(P)-binding protein [Flavobacterium noncentrifugens]|uniref:Uncharacterized NAD(P)/FAD-binding protein YdhS n=1 Tax=Flavobacterium noncentrifugens TaxID=1128970 RepID=A0A1G8YCJ7_9FLAO|nr:FAD/NAD(P)-binding protein [Flavobacterium noncentrifugens]SDK00582.1 Uncharacterized NAD(P)/FAD-binding protein YdhS [Flavobacterium noncentrifugens]